MTTDPRVRRTWFARGTVQGVGFRPFVARLARELSLDGHVRNTVRGVELDVAGASSKVAAFHDRLVTTPPFDQLIDALDVVPPGSGRADPPASGGGFHIEESDRVGTRTAWITPDQAMCPTCAAEIRDPDDRRYGYAFTTCAQCGPRYSILRRLPFDRAHTVMADFPMCEECRSEYEDPCDRRHHAQTMACPICGPRLSLTDATGMEIAHGPDAILRAAVALAEGEVVAVLGVGGFQLLVDATSREAVACLRDRKRRPRKPLAVMVSSIAAARREARIGDLERRLLEGPVGPIVLVEKSPDTHLDENVAPRMNRFGLFLPTTPLHALLLDAVGGPLVATSGNPSGEPLCIDPDEGRRRLGGMADLFLVHDRPVLRPVDDSVVRVVDGRPVVLRAARGLAPITTPLGHPSIPGVAVGAFLRSTVTISTGHDLVTSAHLGEASSPGGRRLLLRTVQELLGFYGVRPEIVSHDRHPDLPSTRLAEVLGRRRTVVSVQHHHAHAAAVLHEHDRDGPALALTWDGTGFGTDATIWGGEALVVTRAHLRRAAHLRTFRLPGGDAAVSDPRRVAFALLHASVEDGFEEHRCLAGFSSTARRTLRRAIDRGLNAPETTSMGRLLDGLAAILGLAGWVSYDGEPAILLEQAAERARGAGQPLRFDVRETGTGTVEIDWRPLVRDVVARSAAGRPAEELALDVLLTVAAMGVAMAGCEPELPVILTGGCFQNRILTEHLADTLRARGREVLTHRWMSPGDGAISMGQMVHALAVTPPSPDEHPHHAEEIPSCVLPSPGGSSPAATTTR